MNDKKTENPGSAPELPKHIAESYGLHHARPDVPVKIRSDLEKPLDENPQTDKAVDEIMAKESDQLLAQASADPPAQIANPKTFRQKLVDFFKAWWGNKKARWLTIASLAAIILVFIVVPWTRYFALNTVGVRASSSVIIVDDITNLPLKNVQFSIDNQSTKTDVKGVAKLSGIKLGKHQVKIERLAFAPITKATVIGWGSNPLGTVRLTATGLRYTVLLKDFVSGKPISGAEINSQELSALTDKNGKAILTVEDVNATKLDITLSASGYRTEKLVLDAHSKKAVSAILVPSQKTVFVSKASGKYDVYSMDIDGKNKKLLLAGTGRENGNINLVSSPDGAYAALISTRDDVRDSYGYLLQTLVIIKIQDGHFSVVDHAQQIQLIDWLEGRLVYRSTIAAASAANNLRNKLIAYNLDKNSKLQLTSANQFNLVLTAKNWIYYAASSTDPQAKMGLFKVKVDGTGRKQFSEQEIWTGIRQDYQDFNIQTPIGWFTFNIISEKVAKTAAPTSLTSYQFSENGNLAAWTDIRDNKGTLLVYDGASDKNRVIVSQDGLTSPTRWLNSKTIIYRVASRTEVADYVISIDGGKAHKIIDVTPTTGFVQAH